MRNPGGLLTCSGPGGTQTFETFTCRHCNGIVRVPLRADPAAIGGMCYQCMKLVCSTCVATGKCDPFERKLERMEARAEALRSYGAAA